MPDIPLNLQTLYADLVQDVHERIAKPASVYRRTLRNIEFLYAKRRVGVVRRDIFIGRADNSDAQETAKTMQMEMERAEARRVTIVALKAAGMPTPFPEIARVLDALDDAGLLAKIVIVGTAAYQCYPPMIGSTLPRATIMSQDVDIATMSLAIQSDGEAESLEGILKRADPTFTGRMGLRPKDLPLSFRAANGFTVDLLTPILRRDDPNPMPLKNLKAGAVPLQYLRWLIENPVPIAVIYGTGIPAFVPQAARYAIHKLIIAQKRLVNPQKRQKDLAQAKALIEVLKVRDPYALSDARDSAFSEDLEGWQGPIERSLNELKLNAEFEVI